MKTILRFFYYLTVFTLTFFVAISIARNPTAFISTAEHAASEIGSATAGVLDDLTGGAVGSGGFSITPGGSASGASSGQGDQPAPVLATNTPDPPAASATGSGTDVSSQSVWGETGMSGVKVFEYGKSLLPTGEERSCYDQLADGIRNVDSHITIRSGLDPTTVKKIVDYYLLDHAEIFYTSTASISYNYSTVRSQKVYKSYTITPNYAYDKNTVLAMRARMGAEIAQMLAAADGKTSDYKKELALHDALIHALSYDSAAAADPSAHPQSFSAYGAFTNKTAVCEGYAKALKLLLDSAGIESLYVTGVASNGSDSGTHAWNMARISGIWYYLDATFDDPVLVNRLGQYVNANKTDYTYFNFKSKPDHVLGTFDSADPFAADCENYETMPSV